MRIKKWIKQNVEVRDPFEPEPQGRDAEKCKPVRVQIGGVHLRGWHTPADGGVRLLKVMLGGAVVVFFIMVIAAIVDGISRVVK
jgi:hypothetical protein